MYCEWNEKKNHAKHGLSFETAALVFEDPNVISVLDRVVEGEERWQTVGMADGMAILLVAHTEWEDEEPRIRIISARKATWRKGKSMKKESRRKLTRKQAKELASIARLPEGKIDLTDILEITDWSGGVVGKFYRPIKKPVTIRVDADVLAWLKSRGKGYQTRINKLLREAMQERGRPSAGGRIRRRRGMLDGMIE